jgi:hypothetical protein
MYIDNVLIESTASGTIPAISAYNLALGYQYYDGGSHGDDSSITMDDFLIMNRTLNSDERLEYWSSGLSNPVPPAISPTAAPFFVNPTPINGSASNTQPILNCSHNSTDVRFNLIVDNVYQYINVTANYSQSIIYYPLFTEGLHNYSCNVQNATNGIFSSNITRNFIYDVTIPVITASIINNTIFNDSLLLLPVSFNVSINDTNLFNCSYLYEGINYTVNCYSGIIYSINTSIINNNNSIIFSAADKANNINHYTLNWHYYSIHSVSFINSTFEGITNQFFYNLSFMNKTIISAKLNYNGTNYTSSLGVLGNKYMLSNNIEALNVSALSNFTFNWIYLLNNNITASSPSFTQAVYGLGIDDCSGFTHLLINYTLYDEGNQTILTSTNPRINIYSRIYSTSSEEPIIEDSQGFNANNATICISESILDLGFRLYSTTEYYADDYVHEFDYIQNYRLTSTSAPLQIKLYDLFGADSTSFLMTYKNNVFLPEEGAIIEILRFYVDQGSYTRVEDGLTDINGQSIGHFVNEEVTYAFMIKKEGELLATFYGITPICQELPCKINLYEYESIEDIDTFGKYNNLDYLFNYNDTLKTLSVSFAVTDSTNAEMKLTGYKYDSFGNETFCNDILSSSSGTLSCSIPSSYGNSTVQFKLYKDNSLVSTRYYTDNPAIFGYTGYFMAAILYISLPLMALSSPVATVILAIFGLLLSGMLALVSINKIFAAGSVILWFIIAGAIIIYKLNQRQT